MADVQEMKKEIDENITDITDVTDMTETDTTDKNESEDEKDPDDQPDIESDNQDTYKMEFLKIDYQRNADKEINTNSRPLQRSEVYFCADNPFQLQPLSKYFMHEWSEVEHIFQPVLDYAEEMYSDWSPCPSPTQSSICL